jgi:hypothetical protein
MRDQVAGGPKHYGGIVDKKELLQNLKEHCIPEGLLDGTIKSYEDFLAERRLLMASKIKFWFESL